MQQKQNLGNSWSTEQLATFFNPKTWCKKNVHLLQKNVPGKTSLCFFLSEQPLKSPCSECWHRTWAITWWGWNNTNKQKPFKNKNKGFPSIPSVSFLLCRIRFFVGLLFKKKSNNLAVSDRRVHWPELAKYIRRISLSHKYESHGSDRSRSTWTCSKIAWHSTPAPFEVFLEHLPVNTNTQQTFRNEGYHVLEVKGLQPTFYPPSTSLHRHFPLHQSSVSFSSSNQGGKLPEMSIRFFHINKKNTTLKPQEKPLTVCFERSWVVKQRSLKKTTKKPPTCLTVRSGE